MKATLLLLAVTLTVITSAHASAEETPDRAATLDYLYNAAKKIEDIKNWPQGRSTGTHVYLSKLPDGKTVQDFTVDFTIDWKSQNSFRELRIKDNRHQPKSTPEAKSARPVVACFKILLTEVECTTGYARLIDDKATVESVNITPRDSQVPMGDRGVAAPFDGPLSYAGTIPVSALIDGYRKQKFLPSLEASSEVVEEGDLIILRIFSGKERLLAHEWKFNKTMEGRLVSYEDKPLPNGPVGCWQGTLEWSRDKHGFLYLKSHHSLLFQNNADRTLSNLFRYDVTEYDSEPELTVDSFLVDRLEIPEGTPYMRTPKDANDRGESGRWGIKNEDRRNTDFFPPRADLDDEEAANEKPKNEEDE